MSTADLSAQSRPQPRRPGLPEKYVEATAGFEEIFLAMFGYNKNVPKGKVRTRGCELKSQGTHDHPIDHIRQDVRQLMGAAGWMPAIDEDGTYTSHDGKSTHAGFNFPNAEGGHCRDCDYDGRMPDNKSVASSVIYEKNEVTRENEARRDSYGNGVMQGGRRYDYQNSSVYSHSTASQSLPMRSQPPAKRSVCSSKTSSTTASGMVVEQPVGRFGGPNSPFDLGDNLRRTDTAWGMHMRSQSVANFDKVPSPKSGKSAKSLKTPVSKSSASSHPSNLSSLHSQNTLDFELDDAAERFVFTVEQPKV